MADAAAVSGLASSVRAPDALAAFEVAVAGADRVLALADQIAVHADAHRAARLAPLGTGIGEDPIEPLGFGGFLDLLRTWNDQHTHAGRDLVPAQHFGRSAQIGQARVGAAADEHDVDRMAADRLAGAEAHVGERLVEHGRRPRGSGTAPEIGMTIPGCVPYVTIGSTLLASRSTSRS